MGNTVTYLDVTENTQTAGDPDEMYFEPTVSGNSLDFNPIGFVAESVLGSPLIDNTDSQLTMMVESKFGNAIDNILFTEAGDTSLSRGLGTTDDADTQVTTSIFIDILELNGLPISQINAGPFSMSFSPSDGDYVLSTDGGGDDDFDTEWTGSALIEFAPILASLGIDGDVTKINVTLDNRLRARSTANSSALIAKKDLDASSITIEVNFIPEPASILLAMTGFVALAAGRRLRG